MTQHNGMDIHFYPTRTEMHLNPPPFKIKDRVGLTEKGMARLAQQGCVETNFTFKIVSLSLTATAYMGRQPLDSRMSGGNWVIGISRAFDAQYGLPTYTVEPDDLTLIDGSVGEFTLGAVFEDESEDAAFIALGYSVVPKPEAPIYHEWVDCDYCGGHAVGGIGMACCSDCDCEGCDKCEGSGAIICPYCNKED